MENTKLIIITAPSGAGKTTMVQHLLKKFGNITFSISATTRPKRDHEEDGKDYYFISSEKFQQYIKEDAFIEWEEVYAGQYYGTLKSEIESKRSKGFHIIFDIDVQGAIHLNKQFADQSLTIFVMPPSVDALKNRLLSRRTESDEKIQRRLAKARSELQYAYTFDKVIYNKDLAVAKEDIEKVVSTFLHHG